MGPWSEVGRPGAVVGRILITQVLAVIWEGCDRGKRLVNQILCR